MHDNIIPFVSETEPKITMKSKFCMIGLFKFLVLKRAEISRLCTFTRFSLLFIQNNVFSILNISSSALLHDIELKYKSLASKGEVYPCPRSQRAVVNNRTVDVSCDVSERVYRLILSGPGINSLCSLYISGGETQLELHKLSLFIIL